MRSIIATIAGLLGLIAVMTAQADLPFGRHGGGLRLDAPYLPPGREARDNEPRHGLSPGEAAQRAQHLNGGGRVLSVEPAGDGYRVKLLRDGEVRVVYVQ